LLYLTRLLLLCLNLLLLVWVGVSRRSQGKDLPKTKLVTVPLLEQTSTVWKLWQLLILDRLHLLLPTTAR
jgi:hypothetical protein